MSCSRKYKLGGYWTHEAFSFGGENNTLHKLSKFRAPLSNPRRLDKVVTPPTLSYLSLTVAKTRHYDKISTAPVYVEVPGSKIILSGKVSVTKEDVLDPMQKQGKIS